MSHYLIELKDCTPRFRVIAEVTSWGSPERQPTGNIDPASYDPGEPWQWHIVAWLGDDNSPAPWIGKQASKDDGVIDEEVECAVERVLESCCPLGDGKPTNELIDEGSDVERLAAEYQEVKENQR